MVRAAYARTSAVAALVTSLFLSSTSRGDDRAAATALFDEGMALMKGGNLEEACRKLEASERLYQGLGTRANLGECYEQTKRFASSWSMYRGALSLAEAKGDARTDELRRRVSAVAARLSHVTVVVPTAAKVAGLRVARNAEEVPEASWGVAVPVDGGKYAFSASAPGHRRWSADIEIPVEAGAIVVTLPALELEASEVALSPPNPATPAQGASPTGVREGDAPRGGDAMRYGGIAMIGLGVVGLGVGGYFGLTAMSKKSDASAACDGPLCRSPQGVDDTNDAIAAAKLSSVLFGAGVALVAGGTTLYLLAPRSSGSASAGLGRFQLGASITSASTSVSVRGAW